MKNFGTVGNIAIAVAAVIGIPRLAGALAARTVGWFGNIDPNGVFLWASVHHVWQFAATVVLMLLIHPSLRAWGFNCDRRERSLYLFGQFLLYFVSIAFTVHVLLFFLGPPPRFGHSLIPRNVAGELGFKLILSGTCEEPLFRGLVMVLLYQSMKGVVRVSSFEMPYAGLVATLLFMIAHMGLTLWPPAIHGFSPIQQVQAFGLGLFYAWMFHQTRSLLGPVLVHNSFNFILTGLGMLSAVLHH